MSCICSYILQCGSIARHRKQRATIRVHEIDRARMKVIDSFSLRDWRIRTPTPHTWSYVEKWVPKEKVFIDSF